MLRKACVRLFAGVLSASLVLWLAGCGGSAGLGPITITAASSTVDGTDTITLTATVTNDKNTAGVTWTASAGTLSNTTTTSATFTAPAATSSPQSITITATSVADSTKTGTVTITVPATPAVASLTAAQETVSVGTAYSVALTGTGGVAPYKWTLASGSGPLPPCLSLSSSGTLSSPAIPTAACAGVYSGIKFTMTDSGTPNALTATSSAQTITVVGPTLAFNATLPAGAVGVAYSGGVTATGVLGTTVYSLKGSFPTSGHLTFNTTTGAITGTPYANDVGTYNFTVTVVDQYGDTLTSGPLTFTINAPTITFAVPAATATVGTAYSSSAGASGAAGTTTYTLQGSLPSSGHLVFNAGTGAITGTPYAGDVGTYSFKVSVTDQYGDTATSGTESIVVGAAPAITFGVAPAATGTFNSAYSSAVTASGGAGTLTYALVAGSLPPDLSLATNGALAGTLNKATDVGTFSFSVKASDNYGDSATSPTYQIVVTYPPVIVTSLVPPTGYVGSAYPNTPLAATGGNSGPYTWTWAPATGSALPPGLSLSSAGVIGGTPATGSAGTYNVVVTATDNATPANSGQTTLTITIKPGITINSITLPEGYAGSSYPPTGGNSTVTATGGTGTYTWSIAGATGSSVPSGLSINPSSGLIGGTLAASSAGSYSLVVTATDNATPANTASITLPLTVGAAVSIATTNPQPNAYPGAAYASNTFTGSGGNGGPYNWTLTAASGSSVPAGFAIGAGPSATTTITAASPSNTGTTTASYNVVVTAKDSLGNQYSTNATINIEPTLTVTSPATLPGVTVGVNPNYQLTATGGSGTYTNGWTVTSGAASLAAVGLSVTSNGVLTGTSPTAGTANFAVTVKDTEGHVSAAANLTVTVSSALTISTTSLPGGNAGTSYSQTLHAGGGSGTYTNWQVTAGASTLTALNLSLNASTGAITGTPSATGTASFTVQVTDSSGSKATQNLTIQVYQALLLPSPDPGSLPSTAYAGYPYNGGGVGTISGSGGSGNLTISVASGLPADGLSGVASGSVLSVSGTPTKTPTPPYTITFNVMLTDNLTGNSIMQSGYAINVVAPTAVTLTPPSASVPGTGTVTQSYTGAIQAINGVPPYTWYINGVQVTGSGLSVGDNITATSTGGSTLAFSGSPSTAETVGPFTVQVVDSESPTTNASYSYSILVNPNGGTIGGNINFQNNNCSVTAWPTFTVTATNTSTSQTYPITTDGSGNFTLNNLPAGTYTLTPSIPQASSSVFSPASYTGIVVSNGSNITGENFNAVVGYTVSGTVSYTGSQFTSQGGQIYMVVNNNCGGTQGSPGTSVTWSSTSSTPSYQIRGVGPGTYTVQAAMDPSSLGQGAPNVIDPLGTTSSFTVGAGTSGGATNENFSLSDPTFITPSSNPTLKVIPSNGGWLLSYKPPLNNYNQEEANQYVVQWAVSTGTDAAGNPTCALSGASGSSFGAVAGSHSFIATGDKQDVWILNNTSMGTGTFASGTAYCFQVRAFDSINSTHASGWTSYTDSSGSPEAVASATSTTFCSTNCTTLQGSVTIPSGVSIKPGAPLYIGYFQQSSGGGGGPAAIYATEVTNPVSGGAGNSFSLTIPNGTGYVLFGILDQNNDGMIDAYDVTNVRQNNSSGVAFSGGTQTNQNLTLPSANSMVQVQTNYSTSSCTGCSATYSINLKLSEGNKLPVAVTLSSTSVATPYVMMPVDLSLCQSCGSDQFYYYTTLPGGTPSVGDSFGFTVTYSDGSQDNASVVNGAVTAFGSTGAVVGPSDLATNLQTTAGTTPNFTWTFPSSPSDYTYQFNLYQSSNCSSSCEIWQIPGQNSNANGFTYAQTQTGATTGQITWGTDPTGDSANTPSSSSLNSTNDYNWSISVQDSNGNSAQANATDNNP